MRDFGYLNKKIREHVVDIKENYNMPYQEYLEFMRSIYIISDEFIKNVDTINSYKEKIYYDSYKRGISLEETLKIVLKFLKTIDSSLCTIFEEAIINGTILFHSKKELKKLQISKENFYYCYNLTGLYNGKPVVNIILTNTISDVFVIVHEFAHFLSLGSKENKSITWFHFTEGYSYAFEMLLLEFLKEEAKWKSEAEKYYDKNNYIMCLKTFEFRNEFVFLDIFSNYGSFSPQKVLKYCEDENFKEKIASIILNNARITEGYLLREEKGLKDYLEDSRYVLALPFSMRLTEKVKKDKDVILNDIFSLEDKSYEYFFDKYDLENVEGYQKIFRM